MAMSRGTPGPVMGFVDFTHDFLGDFCEAADPTALARARVETRFQARSFPAGWRSLLQSDLHRVHTDDEALSALAAYHLSSSCSLQWTDEGYSFDLPAPPLGA